MPRNPLSLIAGLLLAGAVWLAGEIHPLGGVEPAAEAPVGVAGPQFAAVPFIAPPGDVQVSMKQTSDGYVGAAGCAAANCHGGSRHGGSPHKEGPLNGGPQFSAYQTWIQQDPHARAYEVLFKKQSEQIARLLGLQAPAHRSKACLSCHSIVADSFHADLADDSFLADGVSCEACHGPARKWIEPHRSRDWKNAAIWPEERKTAAGFHNTKNLVTRARVCAGCHIGSAGRDVNHDLIAAGHPRLDFEFGAYHANMPSHWDRKQDKTRNSPALEARIWAIGQAVSAEASLKLLQARALSKSPADNRVPDSRAPWPEFGEYSCFACHHDLQSPAWRQEAPRLGRHGRLDWGLWHFSRMPQVVELLAPGMSADYNTKQARLKAVMEQRLPERGEVAAAAKELQTMAEALVDAAAKEPFPHDRLHQLLAKMTSQTDPAALEEWESAAQLYLALVAVRQGYVESTGRGGDDPAIPPLEEIRRALRFPTFPTRYDSPREFQPDRRGAIQREIDRILKIIEGE